MVQILTKEGKLIEGETRLAAITVQLSGAPRKIALAQLLSVHSGDAASPAEMAKIDAGLTQIAAAERKERDRAVEELTAIGLPVLTPLLKAYKDTDQHEPKPLYRLFDRIVPPGDDAARRDVSLLRLANGEVWRGEIAPYEVTLSGVTLKSSEIRRLAVRQKTVTRRFPLHSLRHCTQIEYLDSGVELTDASLLKVNARGWVRLAFNEDGWASDPGGLRVPGPNYKTNLVDGFPFGAIVGRVGAGGTIFLVGQSHEAKQAAGRLQLAINDNRHWQNNVGAYQVTLQATNAYDLGGAQ